LIFTEGSESVQNNDGSGRPKNIRIQIHITALNSRLVNVLSVGNEHDKLGEKSAKFKEAVSVI
jgi:hypothetical protein